MVLVDKLNFNSNIELGNISDKKYNEMTVKDEPMLFSCDWNHAESLGGPITREFLSLLPYTWENAIFDSRVHMLMPGWWPCIPGWHHDDVPRTRIDGQPNYHDPANITEHAMLLVNGEIAPTKFAIGELELWEPVFGRTIYQQWHPIVEMAITNGSVGQVDAPSNRVIYFNHQTFHRGVQAVKGGWRFFIRATKNSSRKPTNELRRQVQVYLSYPEMGW
jgi:hypothetical protein